MKLNLYDKDLNRIAIIDERYISCLWSEAYNSTAPFTVELNAVDEYKQKIKEDYYIGRNDRDSLMVIKSVKVEDGTIVASGKTANRVLDDVAFVGTIKSGSQIDTSISEEYNKSTKYRNVFVRADGLGVEYEHDISHKSFLELCEIMCGETDSGFKAIRNGNKVEIVFYKPNEKGNLVFSPKYGNINLNSISISNETFKNYAIVLGQGEDENRTRVDIDKTGGEERREIIFDARFIIQEEGETDSSYRKRLSEYGNERLLEYQKIFSCAFAPYAKDFGVKYDLGDILTVYLTDYDIKLQARVMRFTQKSQNNKTTTNIEVGNIFVKRGK